jgi:hypothetical protein
MTVLHVRLTSRHARAVSAVVYSMSQPTYLSTHPLSHVASGLLSSSKAHLSQRDPADPYFLAGVSPPSPQPSVFPLSHYRTSFLSPSSKQAQESTLPDASRTSIMPSATTSITNGMGRGAPNTAGPQRPTPPLPRPPLPPYIPKPDDSLSARTGSLYHHLHHHEDNEDDDDHSAGSPTAQNGAAAATPQAVTAVLAAGFAAVDQGFRAAQAGFRALAHLQTLHREGAGPLHAQQQQARAGDEASVDGSSTAVASSPLSPPSETSSRPSSPSRQPEIDAAAAATVLRPLSARLAEIHSRACLRTPDDLCPPAYSPRHVGRVSER